MTNLISRLIRAGHSNLPPKRWPDYRGGELDRSKFITSSEISKCAREIVFSKTSPTVGEEGIQGFAERGHTAERWIVERLEASNGDFSFHFLGDDQVSFFKGSQSGTPDGLGIHISSEAVAFEFKCIDPRTNKSVLPKKPHVEQLVQNMYLINECTGFNVTRGIIAYIDASNYNDIREHEVEFTWDEAERLTERADMLIKIKNPSEAEPEGIYTGACKFCQFKHQCNGAELQRQRERQKMKGLNNVASTVFS